MFDQNDQQGQPQDNQMPYGQAPVNDGPLGIDPGQQGFGGAPAVPPTDPVSYAPSSDSPVANDDLLDIKQNALKELNPLVQHLDQTPEEKFKTTMMMIQASDDQSLVQSAYEAAKKITDEKARAQALLDVVNEINYFTQHNN